MKRLQVGLVTLVISVILFGAALAQDLQGTVTKGANLRAGPGTTYAIVGKASAGETVTITTKNADGSWYKLQGGQWIAAFLVEVTSTKTITSPVTVKLPVKANPTVVSLTLVPPTATPIPTSTPVPAPTENPLKGQRYGAVCGDGSTSGATGRGACSHHGGVDHWLVYQ